LPLVFKNSFENILTKAGDYMSLQELDVVRRAYEFTAESFRRQKLVRFSGEPAIIHPLAVAEQLVDWRMDAPTVAAGFLHDTIEDPNVHPLQLRAVFKEHVAALVDGVTKLKKFEIPAGTDEDTAYYYKIFLAVAEDIRVALIKTADRLHNMRTLRYLPGYKRIKNCNETLRIFVPLTTFLGMDAVREEMEDISFEYLQPAEFERTIEFIDSVIEQEDEFFTEIIARINLEMRRLNLTQHVRRFTYSIKETHRLMQNGPGPAFPKTGFVEVTVPDEESCYRTLRAVHRCFQNLSNGFQDTIPFPSIDLKRMIESSVLHASGRPFIVRIVSSEMKRVNRWGIVPYLAAPNELHRSDFLMERVREIGDIVEKMRGDKESPGQESMVNIITRDLLQKNIFVITSDGKHVELPDGSTVLDFAYKIDPEVGSHFSRAFLNSREAGMGETPESCDQIGIETDEHAKPGVSWMEHAKTPSARMYIQKKLLEQTKAQAVDAGRTLLLEKFRSAGLASSGKIDEMETLLWPVIQFLELPDLKTFYGKVGYGEVLVEDAIEAMREQYKRMALVSRTELEPVISGRQVFQHKYEPRIVEAERPVRGALQMCEACAPLPGDNIVLVYSSRRAVAHRKECRRVGRGFGRGRPVAASWNRTEGEKFPARIKVKSFPGEETYLEILHLIDSHGAKLLSSERNMKSPDGLEMMEFLLEVESLSALNTLCSAILGLRDAVVATRI